MKKETTNQIIKDKVNVNLMNLIFERVDISKPILYTEEEQVLMHNKEILNIKVQSVALPKGFVYIDKSEDDILKWMTDKIHSQHSAFSQLNFKYKDESDRVNWSNNKMQNKRYLEINGRFTTNRRFEK